jgi:hypothetical protein
LRGIGILRSSSVSGSANFAFREFCELRVDGVLRSSPPLASHQPAKR